MKVTLRPDKVLRTLITCVIVLLILSIAGNIIKYTTEYPDLEEHVIRLIDFDTEQNIPSYFSSLLLLSVSILLMYIARSKRTGNFYKQWLGLSLIFAFLAIDEAVSIHEILIGPMRYFFNLDGIFYYAWVIPYGIIFLMIGIYYIKFLFSLPKTYTKRFIISAAIFIFGALVMEMIGSSYVSHNGGKDLIYGLLCTVEETFEMVGMSYFIYTLLAYMPVGLSQSSLKLVVNKRHRHQHILTDN
ncbi:hypothetical protein LVD15_24430 [Fulvivirga maritima]|uniref:hypothetical protein n=1 Tax=Fulvivirga maritima TaxID=2904247 RepID=UPI001F439C21|nr:hypothetical protein [Fulvivirga maritima]UII26407.1 hypothetical protein LVD15_24430 [Fulvivirga maritima]